MDGELDRRRRRRRQKEAKKDQHKREISSRHHHGYESEPKRQQRQPELQRQQRKRTHREQTQRLVSKHEVALLLLWGLLGFQYRPNAPNQWEGHCVVVHASHTAVKGSGSTNKHGQDRKGQGCNKDVQQMLRRQEFRIYANALDVLVCLHQSESFRVDFVDLTVKWKLFACLPEGRTVSPLDPVFFLHHQAVF